MGSGLRIEISFDGKVVLPAELYNCPAAQAFSRRLPLRFMMHRWGEEYYGDCGVDSVTAPDAREEMEVGELALWPAGRAFCVFFGPTPASSGDEPRAYEPVNPIGRLLEDPAPLRELDSTVIVEVRKSG